MHTRPASDPRVIIAKLHAGTVRAPQDPAIREHFISEGAEPVSVRTLPICALELPPRVRSDVRPTQFPKEMP